MRSIGRRPRILGSHAFLQTLHLGTLDPSSSLYGLPVRILELIIQRYVLPDWLEQMVSLQVWHNQSERLAGRSARPVGGLKQWLQLREHIEFKVRGCGCG